MKKLKYDIFSVFVGICGGLLVVFFAHGLMAAFKPSIFTPNDKQQAINAICKKYDHTWNDWGFNNPENGGYGYIEMEDTSRGNYLWIKKCLICGSRMGKFSFSSASSDATEAMVAVAKDEAEKTCAKLREELKKEIDGKADRKIEFWMPPEPFSATNYWLTVTNYWPSWSEITNNFIPL